METFSQIIDAIGVDVLTEKLGLKGNLVTVWKHRDKIPSQYWGRTVRIAHDMGVAGVTMEVMENLGMRKAA